MNKVLDSIYINLATVFIFSSSLLLTNVYATHISEPVLSMDKNTSYSMNETISVNGWVKYDDKPASDVLILLKLMNSNGDEIFQDQVRSDSNGNFTSNINILDSNITGGGSFTLLAESQCKDEHRNICNYNSISHTLVIN